MKIHWFHNFICLLLAAALVTGVTAVPAHATEDPMASRVEADFVQPAGEEPVPEETEPEVRIPAEALPASEMAAADPEGEAQLADMEEAAPPETEPEMPESGEAIAEETVARVSSREDMPLYFQTDYPDSLFADSTIAKSGCSVTALAMVASYMTGYDYLPEDMARYFGGVAENNIDRLEKGSEALGLTFRKAENWHKARAAIQEGKVAIVLLGKKSNFTDSQHFIVVTGVNEEGRYLVNDPYEPNYDLWCLKDGFVQGFEEKDIVTGYSGAWIYDRDAMPEEVPFYAEAQIDRSNPRYPHIELTEEDKYLLACVIWAEARGEPEEGQQAVAEVILNRLASDRFSNTLRGVIYGEGQFRSVEHLQDATPWQAQYDAIERAIYGPYILPEDVCHFATFRATDRVWGTIGGHIFCYAAE